MVLKKVFTEITMISPIYQVGEGSAIAGGKKIENTIQTLGITSEYFLITNRTLLAGIALSNYHVDNGSPVCVIGYDIAKKLFPYTSAVQQVINVADKFRLNYNCRIIGILNSQTNTHGQSPNLDILLPYTYFKSIAPHFWASRAYSASVQIATGHDVEQMGIKIRNYFVKKYGASGVFSVDSDSTLIAQMKKFISIFTLLLSVISLLLLLVGGIGINNMVLISVTERIKEFGIRKALGATNKTIRMQVLLESLGICMMAGFLGLVIGFGAYEVCILLASKWVANLQFTWIFLPGAMLLSFCAIIVVGILSGLIPAIRAEKLEIIEALRAE